MDESTVYDWITWWKSERGLGDAPRSGRPPELSAEDKGLIRKLVEENDPNATQLPKSYLSMKGTLSAGGRLMLLKTHSG